MNTALILAGGMGSRMGENIPKQYIRVKNRPIIDYCLECFFGHQQIDKIQIVAGKEWQELILSCIEKMACKQTNKFAGFSMPGQTRQLSILNGLQDIMKYACETDKVIIHDAARPLVKERLIFECIDKLQEHEGVLPVLPMKDTVYIGKEGHILSLLERENVLAGQAPEAFVLGKYYQANINLLPNKIMQINGSTEPAVLAGMDMVYIQGDENNFKITTKADLERFKQLIDTEK